MGQSSGVHSSKGLEFDVVFVPGMAEGTFPDYRALNKPKELLEEGRNAWLQSRTIARTQDAGLAGKLSAYLDLGRTMAFDAELEAKVHGLSLDAVNAAFRKYLDPSQVNMVKAGDFAKKPGS